MRKPTPETTQRARIAGLARVAKYGGQATVAAPRRGFEAKFLHEVDPDGELPPAERAARAKALLRSHMLKLAMKSARARKKT